MKKLDPMKLSFLVAGALVAGLVVWAVLTVWKTSSDISLPEDAPREHAKKLADSKPSQKIPTATNRVSKARGERRPPKEIVADGDVALSAEDQKLMDDLQAASDDENFKSVCKYAALAAKSASPEVRAQAVETLQWFGQEALPELTMFMADADDDVRDAACNAWQMGVSQIEDPKLRGETALAGMKVVRDRDHLDSMVMEIDNLPNSRQIRILQELIRGENSTAASVAREHYEFVTGEKYEGPAAARKWLSENPD